MSDRETAMARLADALIVVEASTIPDAQRERAGKIATLMAWCGQGDLTPNEVHAFLRDDESEARPRAVGTLVEGNDGAGYLATACHVLSERGGAGPRPVFAIDFPDASLSQAASAEAAEPTFSMTEITLDARVRRDGTRPEWFPAVAFPHLDLALIRLGRADGGTCTALRQAGFGFVPASRFGTRPSGERVAVDLIRPAPDGFLTIRANVSGLSENLSLFWLDQPVPPGCGAAPVFEGQTIVGLLAPQLDASDVAHEGGSVQSAFVAATKAGFLRDLLDAFARSEFGRERP